MRPAFVVKNRKKRGFCCLFWPINWCCFNRINIFLSNTGTRPGDFFVTNLIWKKWHNSSFFEKMDIFWLNLGIKAVWFLANGRFFDEIWAWEQLFFSRKIGENGILLTLGAYTIGYFWQNLCFLTDHGHDSGMFIMNTFWKKNMRALFFERMDVFLTKCGHESGLFFTEWTWRFFDEIWAREQSFFQGNRLGKEERRAKSFIKMSSVKLGAGKAIGIPSQM